jgi:hypothetical protein
VLSHLHRGNSGHDRPEINDIRIKLVDKPLNSRGHVRTKGILSMSVGDILVGVIAGNLGDDLGTIGKTKHLQDFRQKLAWAFLRGHAEYFDPGVSEVGDW